MEPHQIHQYGVHHVDYSGGGGGGGGAGGGGDRFPQWSIEEAREFLMIRADLDPAFMESKRNRSLWEVVATQMRVKGYNRTSEQCKCKWKNLVTRYKGCETMETESMRQQFPLYNEMQAIFGSRMQRMLWMEVEGGGESGSKKRPATADRILSDDEDEEEDDDENEIDSEEEDKDQTMNKKKRKRKKRKSCTTTSNKLKRRSENIVNGLREIVEEFMKQQKQMEMEWMKAYEAREEEKRRREMEWRQTSEALENERLMMERRWREREGQRRIREEAKAQKMDALFTALLQKLNREEDDDDD